MYGMLVQVYKRTDIGKRQEIYQPVGVFDHEPNGAEITACFRPKAEKRPASGGHDALRRLSG